MWSFEMQNRTRLILYGLALCIILGSLGYSNYLARQLAEKERQGVQLYADALEFITTLNLMDSTAGAEAIGFIHSKVIKTSGDAVPKVLVGENNTIDGHNLHLPEGVGPEDEEALVRERLASLEEEYDPILIEFAEGRFQKVFYGESFVLKQLRWFPLAQLTVAFFFIGIVFAGFAVAKRNEQNKVWVGLAKETAHQLGTPVSSLMAWVELLKLKAQPSDKDWSQKWSRMSSGWKTSPSDFPRSAPSPSCCTCR